ncbi:MAG: hypothetical protein HOK27_04175, partial [Rhodobacteraceae bacterium]|nr:hypothetical protein [Paracoccaceae bacterium]
MSSRLILANATLKKRFAAASVLLEKSAPGTVRTPFSSNRRLDNSLED